VSRADALKGTFGTLNVPKGTFRALPGQLTAATALSTAWAVDTELAPNWRTAA
jgi:hypothetical protein